MNGTSATRLMAIAYAGALWWCCAGVAMAQSGRDILLTIPVSGTVNEDALVNVNGVRAGVEGNIFTASEVGLVEGANVITVTATDLAGNRTSQSITVYLDISPPTAPVVTDDYLYTIAELHTSWTSHDQESGISEYQYAIGTTAGGTDLVPWTSVGTSTEIIHKDLHLDHGTTSYISVKAKNGAGLWSAVGTSNGIVADHHLPVIDSFTVTSSANFHNEGAVRLQVGASDVDGDPLWYQFSANGIVFEDWDLEAQATWQPQETDIGAHSLTVKVKDAHGAVTQDTTTIHLLRTPPRP